jgi:dihydroorotate dehydrogenase electron transfer subunit
MGVAPLYYLTKKLLLEHSDKINDLRVFLGAATASEIVFVQNEFKNLGLNKVLVATDDGSSGHHGLVTELMAIELNPDQIWRIYSCGPHPMMKVVANYCQKMAWPCQVSLETIMACGVAACLGCAIRGSKNGLNAGQYLHVCKEGPVFEAGEVAW